MPLNDFMDRLETLILATLGITVVAFVIVAYIVCKYYDDKN